MLLFSSSAFASELIDLGTFGADQSLAYNINESGQVLEEAQIPAPPDGTYHSFRWQDWKMTDLFPLITVTDNLALRVTGGNATTPGSMVADTPGTYTANGVRFVWGVIGDSFASGEGNPATGTITDSPDDFTGLSWGGSEGLWINNPLNTTGHSTSGKIQDDLFTCHRSDRSAAAKANAYFRTLYGSLLSIDFGSAACTGAQIEHMTDTNWIGDSFATNRVVASMRGHGDTSKPGNLVVQTPQLMRMVQLKSDQGQLDAIYMHVGGNDANNANGWDTANALHTEAITDYLGGENDDDTTLDYWRDKVAAKFKLSSTDPNTLLYRYKRIDCAINVCPNAMYASLQGVPILIAKPGNPISGPRNAGNSSDACFDADYAASGVNAHLGLLGEWDQFYKQNIGTDERKDVWKMAGAMNSIIDYAVLPAASGGLGLPWRVVPAPNFTQAGICTAAGVRKINLNSDAVKKQGADMTRPWNTSGWVLWTTNLTPSLSHGQMHPNDAGYQQYANVLTASTSPLKLLIDAKIRDGLTRPVADPISGLRVADLAAHSIKLNWHDAARSDNAYDVLVMPYSSGYAAIDRIGTMPSGCTPVPEAIFGNVIYYNGYYCRVSGANISTYTHTTGTNGLFRGVYAVRPANTTVTGGSSGSFSEPICAFNTTGSTPSSISVTRAGGACPPEIACVRLGGGCDCALTPATTTFTWTANPCYNQEYVLRTEKDNYGPCPSPSCGVLISTSVTVNTVRSPSGAPTFGTFTMSQTVPVGSDRAKIAGCNQFGCSNYSASY